MLAKPYHDRESGDGDRRTLRTADEMTKLEDAISFLFGEPDAPEPDVDAIFDSMTDAELHRFIKACDRNLKRANTEVILRSLRSETVH
jgi:hypothetical protein